MTLGTPWRIRQNSFSYTEEECIFEFWFWCFPIRTGKLKVPEFVEIVKTSKGAELGPTDPDWYYVRAAAVARHVYLRPNVGVGAVRKIYGRAKRNGTRPNHFCLGSASVARKVMQSLEGVKIVVKDPNGGRSITSTGRRDMDRIAGQVKRSLLNTENESQNITEFLVYINEWQLRCF